MRLFAAIVLVGSGCGSATPAPAPVPPSNQVPAAEAGAAGDTLINHLRAFRDDMCDCDGKRCVREVEREQRRWRDSHDKQLAQRHGHGVEERDLQQQYDACQQKASLSGPGRNDMYVVFEKFTKEMCACADQACAKVVTDELTKWASDNAGKQDFDDKPTDAETAIVKQFTDCATKAMMAGSGPMQPSPSP